ncbi:MAG: DUF87 domain-containing protein [Campylobacterota bacterium]|nr:DUF87 domain-containing protein [Campylobacterota bacterium]
MKELYEKLGLFYLGKDYESDELSLYKSKYLNTHAAIIGMTGSGKTGLGVGLIEEAAIDNIPSIIIDPKGDMGNLALTFPQMQPNDFKPWIDESDAANKGLSVDEMATQTATMWKSGIESHEQSLERVQKLHDVPLNIYTPGSSSGLGINILGSFDAPSQELLDDPDTFSALINATTSSLLALVNIEADALSSKEFLLISNIFKHFWIQGQNLSLEALIGHITNPPFEKIGVLSLNSFYPQSKRLQLAMLFNNVLSSVSFASWIQGEPLNIQNLLYDESGKAKITIFSIAHLNDSQRMFFVTLLLNRFVDWMRTQRGSSTLKALLYMDEVFGFFPPSKNPPSKEPMLLLLKQARAFGVGVILSTQNPVDIDYKGLSNIGTWLIGKLQTKQDISKVLDGLASQIKNMSKDEIANMLSALKGRTFFLKSAHEDEVRIFKTRWVLSYLKGPMSKNDIRSLMKNKKEALKSTKHPKIKDVQKTAVTTNSKPILSDGITQYYNDSSMQDSEAFFPFIAAEATVRFFNQRRGIDEKKTFTCKFELNKSIHDIAWSDALNEEFKLSIFTKKAKSNTSYTELPSFISSMKNFKSLERSLKDYLYINEGLELFTCKSLKSESKVGETLRDFKVRLQDIINEKKELQIQKLEARYKKKIDTLENRLERAMIKLEKEQADVSSKTTDTLVAVGMGIFGALFGKKTLSASNISKGARAIKSGGRVLKERGDVKNANRAISKIQDNILAMQDELEDKLDTLEDKFLLENYSIAPVQIKPRKMDIHVKNVVLLWER